MEVNHSSTNSMSRGRQAAFTLNPIDHPLLGGAGISFVCLHLQSSSYAEAPSSTCNPSMETTSPTRHYDFSIQIPIRRPRAWERAPKTPVATRYRGRKVWKRYELRSKEETGTRENPINVAEDVEAGEGSTTPARPIKRQKNVQSEKREGAEGYIATMRSEAHATPKRGSPT